MCLLCFVLFGESCCNVFGVVEFDGDCLCFVGVFFGFVEFVEKML